MYFKIRIRVRIYRWTKELRYKYFSAEMRVFVPNRSRHFRVTPRDKGVMSTCRWHGDALLARRSRRGNGNDGYCDAGPQAMLNCAEVELTWLAAS